jgi:hypothetical protein
MKTVRRGVHGACSTSFALVVTDTSFVRIDNESQWLIAPEQVINDLWTISYFIARFA